MPEGGAGILPFVSVIMPVRNGAAFIERSLKSVLTQDYPPDRMEILVVDGMSTDETRQIVELTIASGREGAVDQGNSVQEKSLGSVRSSSVMILENPASNVPSALNIGLRGANGDIIFRLDGHSEMAPNYIRACVARILERPDVGCVAGPSIAVGEGRIGRCYALALQSPFGVGGRTFRTLRTESHADTLAFGGYPREVFTRLGEFDRRLLRNQDIEFSSRLRRAGYRLLLIPDTHTLYHSPSDLGAMIRQGYRNGYWNTRMLGTLARALSWRHFVPGVFVTALVVATVTAWAHPWGRYLLLPLGAGYLLASLLASTLSAVRHRDGSAVLLPLIFALMHLSYGFGLLVGLGEYLTKGRWAVSQEGSS